MSGAEAQSWVAAPEGLRFRSLLVSFQRFRRPPGDAIRAVPTSLGALPVAPDRQGAGFLLPLGDEEAFWLGILDSKAPIEIEATLRDGSVRHVAQASGTHAAVAGIPTPEGDYRVLARSNVSALRVIAGGVAAGIELLAPADYSRRSGAPAPEPLDPSAAYGGWRLP